MSRIFLLVRAPLITAVVLGVLVLCLVVTVSAQRDRFGDRTPGVVFVTSQGLYYDTFVVRDPLPPQGRFQLIENGQTEFGPGDPEYLGGRWWEDTNHNGTQDPDDHYFLCPLLPPGREIP
jgi:hypothetical protein